MTQPPSSSPQVAEAPTLSTWFYAESPDSEDWTGPHDTIEEAIEAACSEYDGYRDSFWVDEADPVDWQCVFAGFANADGVLEDLADYVGDNEHVEDPEPEYRTSKAEAQAALELWFATHVKMRDYYQCIGKPTEHAVKREVAK